MEKHLICNGFEAWVTVGGKALPQYSQDYDAVKNEASCWIPSETDQAFVIKYHKLSVDGYDYTACIQLDGAKIRKVTYAGPDLHTVNEASYIRVSRHECRNFMFGSVEMTDDDMYLGNPSSLNIGEIKVTMKKTKVIRRERQTSAHVLLPRVPAETKIHERSKKGVSHQVKYGPFQLKPASYTKNICTKSEVVASFVFRYRPLALLQANAIAPRTLQLRVNNEVIEIPDSPEPSKVKVELDDGERDPRERVIARERALLAELEQIRNEKRSLGSGKLPKKKVKDEHRAHFTPGEVIDLT